MYHIIPEEPTHPFNYPCLQRRHDAVIVLLCAGAPQHSASSSPLRPLPPSSPRLMPPFPFSLPFFSSLFLIPTGLPQTAGPVRWD